MSDYGDNLRKITRYDELKKLIKQAQQTADQAEKLAIEARRSITYINPITQAVQGATQGAVGVVKPTGLGGKFGDATATGLTEGATSAALDALATAGETSGLAEDKPDNSQRDGYYDAQSLLDGQKDEYGKIPPVSAAIASASEVVRSITGLKDDTGRNIILHTVDAALQMLAPDDRESSFADGGIDPTYTAGKTWFVNRGTGYFGPSFDTVVAEVNKALGTQCYAISGGLISSLSPSAGDNITFAAPGLMVGAPNSGTNADFQAPGVINPGFYGQQDCGLNPGDTVSCLASAPRITNWATDLGYTQLGWLTPLSGGISPYAYPLMGRWVAHVYEQGVPQKYRDGLSTLNLFLADGTTAVTVQPLENGGMAMYYGTNTPDGSATANSIYTLGVKREPTGYITPNQLATMLPK